MTSTFPKSFFHPIAGTNDKPSPIHFRAWTSTSRPYNLCADPSANSRWSPSRSIVTCPACLTLLTGPET